MLIDVNVKGCLSQAVQKDGTILHVDSRTQSILFRALSNGDHTYLAIFADGKSSHREVVKVTAVDGTLVMTCRGVSHTQPMAFPVGSIVDTALACTAWVQDRLKGDVKDGVSND